MATKEVIGLFLNLIFISSVFCANVTTEIPTSSPSESDTSSSLPSTQISDKITKWSEFLTQLKAKKEEDEIVVRLSPILKLAHKIHKFQAENQEILENDKNLEKQFLSLKSAIREYVRNLTWGSKCTIRNAEAVDGLYLKIVQSPTNLLTFLKERKEKVEHGNGIKTFWKFEPSLEKLNGAEEQLVFTIHSNEDYESLLCLKYVKQPIAGGWADEGGLLQICRAGENLPDQLITWSTESFESLGGRSEGKIVSWMTAERKEEGKDNQVVYLHYSLEAAPLFKIVDGSAWIFDCE